jgi:hypothetical protein
MVTLNDGSKKRRDPRSLHSYNDWFARVPASNQDVVTVHNPDGGITEISVYLLPEDWNHDGPLDAAEVKKRTRAKKKIVERDGQHYEVLAAKDAWYPWDGMGFVVYEFDHEMIPVYTREGLRQFTRTEMLKNWGISASSVADRTALVIRPPKQTSVSSNDWGVTQSSSRASINGPNESGIPLEDWYNEFFALLQSAPELDFLRKALEEAHPRMPRQIDPDDVKRLRSELKGRLNLQQPKQLTVVSKKNTGEHGDPAPTEIDAPVEHKGTTPIIHPHKRKRLVAVPNQNGPTPITKVPVEQTPDYIWLTEEEWKSKAQYEPDAYKPEHFCVVEVDGSGTTAFYNMGHDIYVQQRTYYTGPYFTETGKQAQLRRLQLSELEEVVKISYATLGLGVLLWAEVMASQKGTLDINRYRELVGPEHMTLAMGGFTNVDPAIKQRIGHL